MNITIIEVSKLSNCFHLPKGLGWWSECGIIGNTFSELKNSCHGY